ncbi:glutathione S-transferase T2-like [Brassica napus]|uniref:glutathione S-transferase T2-like n=1 Tax=Brassica napus TaxID=3708 RepID=UPI0006AB389E|nr:glutathione S-transferase T2-like [Brassica napus]
MFWKRVAEYYASSPHAKESGEPREWPNLKQRWQKINDYTNKFCGAYAAAERHISSGQSETDVLKAAYDIYFANHHRKFNLEHVWCLLRFEQKWLSLNTPKPSGSGKRKAGEECSQTSSTTVGDQDVRSEGSKAAKARKNNTQGLKSIDESKTIMELKKEDLMRKEKLSKLAILDTLLAKPGTLSEAEEVVKNKLLAQLF